MVSIFYQAQIEKNYSNLGTHKNNELRFSEWLTIEFSVVILKSELKVNYIILIEEKIFISC